MKVSVIIPSYNRFKYLLNAIKSTKEQSHEDTEIIVINDCSTQKEYYTHDFKNVKIIHLDKNSKQNFSFPCAAHVRNVGMRQASGEYIAFLDDDDIWFPDKLERQIEAIKSTGCEMCCTDGLIGSGEFNPRLRYLRYNAEKFFYDVKNIYKNKKSNLLNEGFPRIWDKEFLEIHNCCITSSVIINRLVTNVATIILKNILLNFHIIFASPAHLIRC